MSLIDERFWMHRLRSTSLAGVVSMAFAGALFFWHFLRDHRLSWDLFFVIMTSAVVKVSAMIWYHMHD